MSNTRINLRSEAKICTVALIFFLIKGENSTYNATIPIIAMNLFLYHLPNLSCAYILYGGNDRARSLFP